MQVKHHKDVGIEIVKHQVDGWRLHTYQASGPGVGAEINHYLLFEKGE